MSLTPGTPEKVREASEFLDSLFVDFRRVLVAFSGGPDSTALLALVRERCKAESNEIVGVYYNHMLRGDAEAESEVSQVRRTAERLGVTLHEGSAAAGAA